MHSTKLRGARTHNLAGISLDLDPGTVVAIAGPSGSGKSSLAMDTLYAEGQRRFVESFSPYARQFLERLERPPIDTLDPVAAGVAVDRRAPVKSSRSTVATMSDLTPYLAALFVREALPICPEHGVPAERRSLAESASLVIAEHGGSRAVLTYPLRVANAEEYLTVREGLLADGYRRLWFQGKALDLDAVRPSEALSAPELEVVVDRIQLGPAEHERLTASLETAVGRGAGSARVHVDTTHLTVTDELSCPVCHVVLTPPIAGLFSFESPLGACPTCRGFGRTLGIELGKVIVDPSLSLARGVVRPWRGQSTSWERTELKKLCRRHDIPWDEPWQKLGKRQHKLVLEGDGDWDHGKFPGVLGWFRWLETKTYKMHVRVLLSRYRSYDVCAACEGQRLGPTSLKYRVGGMNLGEWHGLEVSEALARLERLSLATGQGQLIRSELLSRLGYLERVGLGYLGLDRQARTLSGGEAQRVTLTTALGTSLSNAMFVLDEPTVGLHASDVQRLSALIRELADKNNIVLVVEHDRALIDAADRVIELGPGAGSAGGRIVFDGAPKHGTAGATSRRQRPAIQNFEHWLTIERPTAHNLQCERVRVPLGGIVAITGPSGSGKSTLAAGIVYRGLARRLGEFDVEPPEAHASLSGGDSIRAARLVDQSPLGRTSRGNAATYTKAWDVIRKRFANTSEAKGKGFGPSHFSFNVAGGRCDACDGEGHETIEMQFLADVQLPCPVCKGRRFQPEVLAVQERGHNVADVLEMSVEQALEVWRDENALFRALTPVAELGLGYLKLGQSLSTLSGGEAQRLKLARAIATEKPGTLFVFDEPSAGLHPSEVSRVVAALDLLVRSGSSVIVVEHDLDLIANADYVIDLGPGGGRHGGQLVAEGTPEAVAKAETRTGLALRGAPPAPGANGSPPPKKRGKPVAPALEVTRAREHNLKEVTVRIPHGSLCVVTGPSGSGKSTLAFDVIFAEGQRRFLETLTPYARQFLPTMARPDVDAVSGVPPSIALEQRTARAGAQSTVATVTEVAHYLRLLYAKLGTPHCPDHGLPVEHRSIDELLGIAKTQRGRFDLLAPAIEARKGVYLDLFTAAARAGITDAIVDGKRALTEDPPRLNRQREHDISLIIAEGLGPRKLTRALLERALRWGKGAITLVREDQTSLRLSERGSCPKCGVAPPELDPRFFSFNTKQGRCPRCEGEGRVEVVASRRRKKSAEPEYQTCPACRGERLAPLPRGVKLAGCSYPAFVSESVDEAARRTKALDFDTTQKSIATPILSELSRRLGFLQSVGLGYLHLDRAAPTLSGGEMQRLRLAAQLGAGLTGALYILDEPTIGLHPSDTASLLQNLRRLVDTGSTVVVVEHDADTIRAADHLIDLGPTGGSNGGHVIASGPPAQVLTHPHSPTGRALSHPPALRRQRAVSKDTGFIELTGARQHNLKEVTLRIPLGHFTVVAGVSGSGKSTLVRTVLLPALRAELGLVTQTPGPYSTLSGFSKVKRALAVDQSPIGRTPRSVPATFLGVWDHIRKLFAQSPDARVRGFGPARFSFNTSGGGRCEACGGMGTVTHEMSFLPDVVTPCSACSGKRFEPRTLEVRHQGLDIGAVLDLTAQEAARFFKNHPKVARPLSTLSDLGADYITLGQGSHTLSGGEAQRLKLAAELTATAHHEPTLYVLDEPTTGLHLADVAKLMDVLDRLVERGDTLVVIEHHPEVIAGADWLVELGPGSGDAGGKVVAEGPPNKLLKRKTKTAAVLRSLLAT